MLGAVVTASGASALVLQVVWQRTIALHSGMDLISSIIVVTTVLAGMGLGSALGGRLADRRSRLGALRALAACNAAAAAVAVVSVPALVTLGRAAAPRLDHPLAVVAFHVAVLALPASLFGVTLPLLSRAAAGTVAETSLRLGHLNALNTIGAAFGALAGLVLVGEVGLDGAARTAAIVLGAVAAVYSWLARGARAEPDRPERAEPTGTTAPTAAPAAPSPASNGTVGRALGLAAGIGAVALGVELVAFRLVDAVVRSNAYSFGGVLALYLTAWGVGSALGAAVLRRRPDPRPTLTVLLVATGVLLGLGLIGLVHGPGALGWGDRAAEWFAGDGFSAGLGSQPLADRLVFGVAVPTLLVGPPVVGLGACFPLVHRLVARDLGGIGRATGKLLAVGVVGNVVGATLTGLVLLDRWGTAGTYRILCLATGVLALLASPLGTRRSAAAAPSPARARGAMVLAGVAVPVVLVAALLPSNQALWSTLLARDPDRLAVAEDRTCASALRFDDGETQLVINGTWQNGHPFDDFHVLLGLLPSLAHPRPRRALAIGLGIGSTSASLLAADDRVEVTTVELCAGNYRLVEELARRGADDVRALVQDPRHRGLVGDGREHLLATEDRYDLIVTDTMRTTSAGAGNVYSREYFELMASRLRPDGIVAIWRASNRVLNGAATTFPYVEVVTVPSYNGSQLILASRSPIPLRSDRLLERFDAVADGALPDDQRERIERWLGRLEPQCVNRGRRAPRPPEWAENRDLHPRDEYFLSNPALGDDGVVGTCTGADR